MEEISRSHSYVCVKVEHVGVIREKLKEIREKFCVSLRKVPPPQTKTDCGSGSIGLSVLFFMVEKTEEASQIEVSQIACRVQSFVDAVCDGLGDHGDDSSYDSDVEGEVDSDPLEGTAVRCGRGVRAHQGLHQDVSRTTSETLAAEYADYVTSGDAAALEFGLRLGYTEPLVRAALRKLGAKPAQNELLAELIRLGAHQQLGDQHGDQHGDQPEERHGARHHAHHPLRPIVIDGSNVAMSHGNNEVFSCRGLRLCVDWFRARGHADITVFVPKWRKEAARPDNLVTEQDILAELERERLLVYTPSRLVAGKRLVCYDDRYILRLAADTDGVVVSNDNYRDLAQENADFRRVVEERILMYSFVNDRFMPPEDPLGRSGPSLEQFLRMPQQAPPCPYAKKCTYGNKCKFSHPERGAQPHKSVTERLAEQAHKQLMAAGLAGKQVMKGKSLSLPLDGGLGVRKAPLTRTLSNVVGGAANSAAGVSLIQQQRPVGPAVPAGPAAALASRSYSVDSVEDANLHRKLQRQLTLNPTYDPRLLQMRRAVGFAAPAYSGPAAVSGPVHPGQTLPGPIHAGQASSGPTHSGHPGVARIASAPDSFRAWGAHGVQAVQPARPGGDSQLWQARQHLHYHLASIFPDDLVATAMSLYPDEVDPQKICGAILSLQKQQQQQQ